MGTCRERETEGPRDLAGKEQRRLYITASAPCQARPAVGRGLWLAAHRVSSAVLEGRRASGNFDPHRAPPDLRAVAAKPDVRRVQAISSRHIELPSVAGTGED